LVQRAPTAQALPHAPQFATSVARLRHAPLHAVKPAAQTVEHIAKEQTAIPPFAVGLHTLPHPPQSLGFDARSTHCPLQSIGRVPCEQAHAPFTHCCPPTQARPHTPQLAALFVRFTQAPPQFVVPAGQVV
jgi:hypothetical protein